MYDSSSDEQSMRDAIGDADTVVNLIGKHYETKHLCFTRKEDGAINRVNSSFKNVRCLLFKTKMACRVCGDDGGEVVHILEQKLLCFFQPFHLFDIVHPPARAYRAGSAVVQICMFMFGDPTDSESTGSTGDCIARNGTYFFVRVHSV